MTRMVKIQDIRLDGGTQFREEIDQNKVKEYAEHMDNGADFPSVQCTFDGSNYWLWDGFHRYFAWQSLGAKAIEIVYTPGTQEDAQDLALSANDKHGLPRSNATKRKQVESALSMERHAGKSDREIGTLCGVSHTFVATVRSPEVKAQQAKNVAKHFEKKASELQNSGVKLHPEAPTPPQDFGPSPEELKANELAQQADRDMLNKMLEEDEPLKVALEENTRLNALVAQLEVRINSLMVEKNEAIKDAKRAQSQLDKIQKAKK